MVNLQKIFEEVDNLDKERIMSIIRTLVHVNIVVPPGDSYREYVDALSPFFKDLNFCLEEVIVPEECVKQIPYPLEGPRINLIANKDFGKKKFISFYGHMDVVPAPNEGA
ncbi:MAG: hypothetical protein ACFFB0_14795 [Promethearchaeota archaeon]